MRINARSYRWEVAVFEFREVIGKLIKKAICIIVYKKNYKAIILIRF